MICGPCGLRMGQVASDGRSVLEDRGDDECCCSHRCPGDGDAGSWLAVPGFRSTLLGGTAGGHRVHWVGSKAGTECGLLRILVALASVCSEGHLQTLEGGAEVVLVVACLVGTRAR